MHPVIPTGYSTFKRMCMIVKRHWLMLLAGLMATMLVSSVDAAAVWAIKPLLNRGFVNRSAVFITWLPLVVVVIFSCRCVLSFLSTYCTQSVSRDIVKSFRLNVFEKYCHLPTVFFDRCHSGQLISTMIYNIEKVSSFTQSSVLTLVREGAYLMGLLVVMFLVSWRLSAILFLVTPPLYFLVRTLSLKIRRYNVQVQDLMGDITRAVDVSVRGHREVKLSGTQQVEKKRFQKVVLRTRGREMRSVTMGALSGSLTQLLLSIPICIVLYLALNPIMHLSAGAFASIIASMMSLLRPVKRLVAVNGALQSGIAAAQSLFQVLDLSEEKNPGSIKISSPVKGDIELKNLSFRYENGEDNALHDIDLTIRAGQTVALVGQSGAGKTTVANLLARFYIPQRGVITLDGIELENYSLSDLRSQFSYVSQQVFLFDDTIANNITYGITDRQVSAEELERVAEMACVMEFVNKLPAGLHTVIGQDGVLLSGGQRQRIAIARALLRSRPILVLDEATSALDSQSEISIQTAISRLISNRTTLIIAHRLSTIRSADNIVVLDKGRIVEQGTHDKLLALNAHYAHFYRLQFNTQTATV